MINVRLKESGKPSTDTLLDFACEYMPRKGEVLIYAGRYGVVEAVIWENNRGRDSYVPWIVVEF